jgi:hypothetical protein
MDLVRKQNNHWYICCQFWNLFSKFCCSSVSNPGYHIWNCYTVHLSFFWSRSCAMGSWLLVLAGYIGLFCAKPENIIWFDCWNCMGVMLTESTVVTENLRFPFDKKVTIAKTWNALHALQLQPYHVLLGLLGQLDGPNLQAGPRATDQRQANMLCIFVQWQLLIHDALYILFVERLTVCGGAIWHRPDGAYTVAAVGTNLQCGPWREWLKFYWCDLLCKSCLGVTLALPEQVEIGCDDEPMRVAACDALLLRLSTCSMWSMLTVTIV